MKPSFSSGGARTPVMSLNRLPYLLKRTLTLTPATDNAAELAPPTLASIYSRPKSPSAQAILLSILPPIRSSALVWTYTRLLCTSAAYIAGMSLYDFIAATLSLNTKGIRIYDVLSQHPPPKSRYKLIEIWLVTVALIVLVIVFVKVVVQFSEISFAQQIRMQMHKMQTIQHNISHKKAKDQQQQPQQQPQQQQEAADGQEEEHKHDRNNTERLRDRALSIVTDKSSVNPPALEHVAMSSKALKAIRDLEERRAIARAVLSSNDAFRYEDDDDEEAEDATQAVIADAVAKGIPLHQILAEKNEELNELNKNNNKFNKYNLDPIENIDTTSILLYRLIDLVAFYLIFVAVYALSNTIQLSFDNSSLLYSFIYFIILIFLSFLVINWLLAHQHALSSKLEEAQTGNNNNNNNNNNNDKFTSHNNNITININNRKQSTSDDPSKMSKRVKRLKVSIGIWKKMSGYIVSSLAYLLAYSVWAFLQSILSAIVDKHVRSSAIYLWAIAALTTSAGAFFLVLLSVRIRSQVLIAGTIHTTNTCSDYIYAVFNVFCCADWWNSSFKIGATPWSTARLHMTVDVVSGQVTSEYHQLMSESLSYILALAFGAALTSSFSVVPADAGTYTVQPSRHAMITYAVIISFVLAVATLQLERWIRHLEEEQRQKTAKMIKRQHLPMEHEPVVKIIHSPQPQPSPTMLYDPTGNNDKSRGSNVSDVDSPQTTRYQCDSEYSSLYILHKQHDYERILRGRDTPDDVEQRRTRKQQQQHAHRLSTSPMPLLSPSHNTLSPPPLRTSQSLPPMPFSPTLYSPPDVISPTMSPEPTPQAKQQDSAHNTTSENTPLLLSPTTQKPLSKQEEAHRQLLSETFLHEYRVALAATLTQGFALLVAYAWVGVFQFVLLPLLMEWNLLDGVGDVLIKGMWSIITFVVYFLLILGTLRILHKQEALEL